MSALQRSVHGRIREIVGENTTVTIQQVKDEISGRIEDDSIIANIDDSSDTIASLDEEIIISGSVEDSDIQGFFDEE